MADSVRIKNESGEEIPPRSFVLVTGGDTVEMDNGQKIRHLTVDQPDGTEGVYLVTGHIPIPDEKYGLAFNTFSPVWVDYYTEPSAGDEVGPTSGNWTARSDGTGFDVLYVDTDQTLALVRSKGGSSCSCPEVHEFRIYGSPSGGTVDFDYTINGTTETVTINYNSSAISFQTAMETHSEVSSGDVSCFDGAFPNAAIYCLFKGNLSEQAIELPAVDDSSLTGTNVSAHTARASSYDWTSF